MIFCCIRQAGKPFGKQASRQASIIAPWHHRTMASHHGIRKIGEFR
jgi:hypothetical protein